MELEHQPLQPEWSEDLFNRIADFLEKVKHQRAKLLSEIAPEAEAALRGVKKTENKAGLDDMSRLKLHVQTGLQKIEAEIPVNDWGARQQKYHVALLRSTLEVIEAHDIAYGQLLSALRERSLLLPLDVLQTREALDYQDFQRAQALPYPLDKRKESFLARRAQLEAIEETGSRWRRSNAVLNLAISKQ